MKQAGIRTLALALVICVALTALPGISLAAANASPERLVEVAKSYLGSTGKKLNYSVDWCAMFVQRCGQEAGLVKAGIFPKAGATSTFRDGTKSPITFAVSLADWFTQKGKGTYHYFALCSKNSKDNNTKKASRSSFVPKIGDLIFFNWDNSHKYIDHVGIVTKSSGQKVYYIDGNSGSGNVYTRKVKSHTMSRTDKDIVGYLRPSYKSTDNTTSNTKPTTAEITFSGIQAPNGGTLEYGKGYHLEGKINAKGGKIANIEAKVTDRDGTLIMKRSVSANASSYTLYNSDLDWDMSFGTLPAGQYSLQYRATPSNGKTATVSKTFTVVFPSQWYSLSPKNAPGSCLDVKGGKKDNRTNVQIYGSNNTASQHWRLTHVGNGWYTLTARNSSKALDVDGGTAKSGTNVQQYSPNGTAAQKWYLQATQDGYYLLLSNLDSGLALDVSGGGTKNGTNVQVYYRNNTDAQKWKVRAA